MFVLILEKLATRVETDLS